ncbi:MAG TPA: sugar ABC transporter substrate-binding protein, partial [Marinobacter sp.]|nr:sugar ABC transporter substrate-binding protein [Marinobacter sp.]
MVGRSFLLVLTLLLSGSLHAESASGPRVVFLSPDDSRFWLMVSGFMEAVADDLDVPLEVEFDRTRHRFSYLELAEQVFSRSELPDYLLIMCKEGVTTQILRRADALGIRVFTFNTDIPPATRDAVGLPRETLPNWIGHMSPDNRGAGQTLARLLAQSA